ncbi:MAG: hypothetical protein QOJ35_3872 [Solirubrobacteraceae bacterium]|jgi:RimJ/RimL family protein N-acetyltransferase|nr:hypothetical protein [Solirubrobacteraceae bacterium]
MPTGGRTLFVAGPLRAVELDVADAPALQRLYDDNERWFVDVTGRPPAADEALRELRDDGPPDIPIGRVWLLGFVDEDGELVAMANVASDFVAERVWHIGYFIVATALHGTGTAHALHAGIESWARGSGAHWLRLAVVVGSARAERFWRRVGYRELRRRDGVTMGERVNELSIMLKPLAGGEPAEYLALVARDRPG